MALGQGEANPQVARAIRGSILQVCDVPAVQLHPSGLLQPWPQGFVKQFKTWISFRPQILHTDRFFVFVFVFFPSNWACMHIGLSSGRAGAGSRPSVGALCNVLSLAKDLAKESQKDYTAALDSVQLPILSPVHFFQHLGDLTNAILYLQYKRGKHISRTTPIPMVCLRQKISMLSCCDTNIQG